MAQESLTCPLVYIYILCVLTCFCTYNVYISHSKVRSATQKRPLFFESLRGEWQQQQQANKAKLDATLAKFKNMKFPSGYG